MSNNISLNDVKNAAFLASENSKTEILKNGVITNPATNSSFEVIAQTESANGFSATVFRNIPQRDWGMT
ncbi:MAG: hypothetical protein MR481_01245 [Campylobacter sp.]|uniref:hypothetical protein n=1 Tax=Campylobacter sp. TaxID=205 RepID=UPI002A75A39C|nr:hypothetical protein [Campylobacter sp.]MCI7246541.1 hypothetical protein [Campylobacter sp.]MCI7446549.1 hypothetical protein [Campylobacter sp.]MDY2763572.1 hypothetical protein [Campylobacter sp.]